MSKEGEYLKYLKTLLSIILGIYPELELLDHTVTLFVMFWGTTSFLFVPSYIPTHSA